MTATLPFTKGHGTENDFVVVLDLEAELAITPDQVRAICSRRSGVGADGLIRVIPTDAAAEPEVARLAGDASWFMDYRNADGSRAQMCGNGSRVFAAYLRQQGLELGDEFAIATRAGLRTIRFESDSNGEGVITTGLGPWRLLNPAAIDAVGHDSLVHVPRLDPLSSMRLDLGNPHTVAALPDKAPLSELDLSTAPRVHPEPVEGTNVEFIRPLARRHLAMRVFERGVGETRSCGTGAAAAALAMAIWSGESEPNGRWRVDVPGGALAVRAVPGGTVELSGPAELVASGEFFLDDHLLA